MELEVAHLFRMLLDAEWRAAILGLALTILQGNFSYRKIAHEGKSKG